MPLESITYISDLVPANPVPADGLVQGDDHLRGIKAALKNTLPNWTAAALNSTQAQIDAAVTFSTSKTLALLAGTAAAPSAYFDAEHGTGFYQSAAGSLDVTIAGTRTLQVSSAGLDVKQGGLLVAGSNIFPVSTTNIAANAVTFGKLLNATQPALIGATAAGAFQEVTLGSGLAFSSGQLVSTTAPPIAGGFKNLVIKNNATAPNTKIDLSADALTVETSAGFAYRRRSVAVTIDASVNGANGLDTSGLLASTWYAVLVIYNPTTDTHAGLLVKDTNYPASITLPSGYTAWSRFGWVRTDSSSHFKTTRQVNNTAWYVDGYATQALLVGASGSFTVGGYTPISVSSFVPTTAGQILAQVVGGWNTGTLGSVALAPSNNFDSVIGTNPPPLGWNDGARSSAFGALVLEGTNVYYAGNATGSAALCRGWIDNL